MAYRIVRTDPPTLNDFLPGPLAFDDPHSDLVQGISVFATKAQARRHARRYPLGRFIAELRLPEDCQVRSTLRTGGHHTVWCEPGRLLAAVVRVFPVD